MRELLRRRGRMRVYVNQKPVDVLAGMTVKHALVSAGVLDGRGASKKAYDEWGNELGLDGALSEGMQIYLKSQKPKTRGSE